MTTLNSAYTCGCCGKEKEILGVASIPFLPMSIPWCADCLRARVIPYSACVMNTALCGGWAHVNEAWKEYVERSLPYHKKSMVEFISDVAKELEEMP